jgi:hypothetical protein
MNKMIVGNALTASLAMAIGFYAGTRWQGEEGGNAQPAAPAAVSVPAPTHPKESALAPAGREAQVIAVSPVNAPPVAPTQQSPAGPEQPSPQVAQAEKSVQEPKPSWEPVVSGFDRKKLEETYQQIYSDDANLRHQALRTLAQLGAEEVRQDLIRIASDEEEISEVRRDLIQQIDWSGNTQTLSDILIRSRDAEARLAAVTAASNGKLTDTERLYLEDVMMENFSMEPEDGIKIATLNHFLSTDPAAFQRILEEYPDEVSSPEVQSYLTLISTPPDQTSQPPQQMEGDGG